MNLLSRDDAFWTEVRTSPKYQECRDAIRGEYDRYKTDAQANLTYSLRWIYYVTPEGSRAEFERFYFARRRELASAALLSLIYPEEEHFIPEVVDLMWAVMDEYCWALPAHTKPDFEENQSFVDLFASETAVILAEISATLGDRLPEIVHERVRREIRVRIVEGMRKRDYWWEHCTMNWAAVCAGGVGIALIDVLPESFEELKPRILSAMREFLSGFPEDGTCLEGVGYWNYGFGFFTAFADTFCRYTGGKEDLFASDKVKQVATYMQTQFLMGNATVSYADGDRAHRADLGLQHFLHQRYPDAVILLPKAMCTMQPGNSGWIYMYRTLMYMDPDEQEAVTSIPVGNVCHMDAGQMVFNKPGYSLAVKAGNNDEPHNHNDIGSFLVSGPEGQILVDLGSGIYTRDYFDPARRYSIFCNSSESHNVPIVNHALQAPGAEYCGTLSLSDPDTVEIDFEKAYPECGLKSLHRQIRTSDRSFVLTDTFEAKAKVKSAEDFAGNFAENSVEESEGAIKDFTERFVTLDPPVVEDTCVRFRGLVMHFDSVASHVSVSEKAHGIHNSLASSIPVYCVDLKVRPEAGKVTLRFEMEE